MQCMGSAKSYIRTSALSDEEYIAKTCSVAVEVVQHKIVQIGPLIQKESDNLYKLGINAAGYI